MSYADVPIKLRTLSRALQISLSKQGIDMDIRDALNAVVDLPALGILDPRTKAAWMAARKLASPAARTVRERDSPMFPAGEVPRIPSPWRIRNDDANIVIYHCATDQLSFKVCTPLEASIVPFLSGEFTWEDIFRRLVGRDQRSGAVDADLRALFNRAIDGFGPKGQLIASEGEVSPSYSDDNRWMFPNFRGYRHPVARLERPIAVNLAITNRCVCDCAYCYAETEGHAGGLLRPPLRLVRRTGGERNLRRRYRRRRSVHPEGRGPDPGGNDEAGFRLLPVDQVPHFAANRRPAARPRHRPRRCGPHLRRVIQVSVDTLDEKTAEFLDRSLPLRQALDRNDHQSRRRRPRTTGEMRADRGECRRPRPSRSLLLRPWRQGLPLRAVRAELLPPPGRAVPEPGAEIPHQGRPGKAGAGFSRHPYRGPDRHGLAAFRPGKPASSGRNGPSVRAGASACRSSRMGTSPCATRSPMRSPTPSATCSRPAFSACGSRRE